MLIRRCKQLKTGENQSCRVHEFNAGNELGAIKEGGIWWPRSRGEESERRKQGNGEICTSPRELNWVASRLLLRVREEKESGALLANYRKAADSQYAETAPPQESSIVLP